MPSLSPNNVHFIGIIIIALVSDCVVFIQAPKKYSPPRFPRRWGLDKAGLGHKATMVISPTQRFGGHFVECWIWVSKPHHL